MPARDLKLRACLKAMDEVREIKTCRSDAIRDVVHAYARNVGRVNSLIMFPPAAVQQAIMLQRVTVTIQKDHPGLKGAELRSKIQNNW
jgi:hypothetical protein